MIRYSYCFIIRYSYKSMLLLQEELLNIVNLLYLLELLITKCDIIILLKPRYYNSIAMANRFV